MRLSVNERRQEILEALCRRRKDNVKNLANEFDVSIRTIKYDIEALSLAYPIETERGHGGCVKVADGYYLGRKYLKPSQQQLLQKLAENLSGEDLKVMNSIFKDFALGARV